MSRLTPEQYRAKQDKLLQEMFEGQKNVQAELRLLTSSQSWPYVVGIAHAILKDYECTPKATTEDWQKYTTMKWALDKLLSTVQTLAAEPIPEPPKAGPLHADVRRKPTRFNTSPAASRLK